MARRETVLLVEDDEALVALLSASLTSWGFRVIVAVDAVQATMMAKKSSPNAVILDVKIPGGTGLDVLNRIKAFDEWSMDIPMIVVSASADPKLPQLAVEQGADEFLHKPLDLKHLQATLSRVLGKPSDPVQACY